jgi:D-tyrosyl-tRNA(Tyr) deacylase
MIAVVTRVASAAVAVEGETIASIDHGLLVLVGVHVLDDEQDAAILADRVISLRIFEDDQGKMNLSLAQLGRPLLAVSQFTLLADLRRGRRPSFDAAARPEVARPLFDRFCAAAAAQGIAVATGRFGATMAVSSLNDGPVTLVLDSRLWKPPPVA